MKQKKVLIIYGYERIVPPFMQTLISMWLDKFDEIKYVTPPMPSYYYTTLDNPKVEVITWNKWQRCKQYLKGILSVTRPMFWQELFKGKVSKYAFFNIGKLFFCSDGFIDMSEPIIKKNIAEGNSVYLMGTWFSVEAFIVARMKKKYPQVKAFTLAHSGEVQSWMNPVMHQCFHEFIFENIDRAYFISQIVKSEYLRDMSDIDIAGRFGDKIANCYLGSVKSTDNLNPEGKCDQIVMVSCSRIDVNKRLDRIILALEKWRGKKIKWIHIGNGILEEEIHLSAEKIKKDNPNIEIEFTGRMANAEVINLYSQLHVDLFVNVSASEGLPISIMEAMSYGIPCIATNVGGTSEIVNKSNGFLLEKDFSNEDLISMLKCFSQLSDTAVQRLRENSFLTWDNKFDARKNALTLYESMMIH